MARLLKCLLLLVSGLLLLLISGKLQNIAPPPPGEYYYSSLLKNNYTAITACLFIIPGLFVGYFSKWNPWLSGISLILILPIAAIYEATVYRGSHNLIPFELAIYFLFSLPAVAGIYIGRYVSNRMVLSKINKGV